MVSSADGSIRLAKKDQRIYDVPTWGSLAITLALELWKLDEAKDPRVVQFHLLDYLSYLQTMFLKFKRFNFQDVLRYDRAYRTLQLRERYPWGTYIP